MKHIRTYQEWIEEDLEDIAELNAELIHWQKIYKKRVFDQAWPKTVKLILDEIKMEVARQIDQIQHHLKCVGEIKNDKTGRAQSNQNQKDVGNAGNLTRNPDQEPPGIKQQAVGSAPEKIDDFGGENK